MASALCSPPPTATAQHHVETPDILLRYSGETMHTQAPTSRRLSRQHSCAPRAAKAQTPQISDRSCGVLCRRLKRLEVEKSGSQVAQRLSWEEDPVTWLVHELLYCCQVATTSSGPPTMPVAVAFSEQLRKHRAFLLQPREQQTFDTTYEDVSAMLHKFLNQNQTLETGTPPLLHW